MFTKLKYKKNLAIALITLFLIKVKMFNWLISLSNQ